MKKQLVLSALAATSLWGGAALARGDAPLRVAQADPQQTTTQTTQDTSQVNQDTWRDASVPDQNTGVGGSGAVTTTTAPTTQAAPVEPGVTVSDGQSQAPVVVQPQPGQNVTVNDNPQPAYLPTEPYREPPAESLSSRHLRGVEVTAGGGVEGYTGSLAPGIDPGVTYGAQLGLRPSKVFGFELGYNGAVNEVSAFNAAQGADIIRNGGSALLTVGLASAIIQPYLLAGVGVNDYQVRGAAAAAGFKNDVSGDVPVGGGLRAQVGLFTADARVDYHFPFDDQFASGVTARNVAGVSSEDAGRYQGTINLGATF